MRSIPERKRGLVMALACAATVAGALGWSFGHPSQAVQKEKDAPKDSGPRVFYGSATCAECHDQEKPWKAHKDRICNGTEMRTFKALDKHNIAYEVLLSDAGQRIAAAVGIKKVTAGPNACLSCHSVQVGKKDDRMKTFSEKEGISCVACHGADKPVNDVGWLERHDGRSDLSRSKWHKLSRADKERQFGMIDLWNPVRRAEVCASCHIGNAAEGKVVTHAMYAAGHPPLPAFEIVTFSDAMPRHWQYLKEKLKEKPHVVQELLKFDKAEAEQEQTTLLALGGLVSLRASLKLLADRARAGADWPELAHFDCYACHHDLRSKSWRQQRTTPGRPGRPTTPPWPRVLAELGAAEGQGTDGGKTLRTKLAAVDDLFAAQPYGDPDKIAKTAGDLAEWVDQQIKTLRRRKPDNTASRRLLGRLLDLQTEGVPDYDSARQLGRALEVLQRQIDADSARQVKQTQSWKALDASLGLTIPVGKEELLPTLPTSLKRLNAYHPTQFGKEFKAVAAEFQQLADKKPPGKTGK